MGVVWLGLVGMNDGDDGYRGIIYIVGWVKIRGGIYIIFGVGVKWGTII